LRERKSASVVNPTPQFMTPSKKANNIHNPTYSWSVKTPVNILHECKGFIYLTMNIEFLTTDTAMYKDLKTDTIGGFEPGISSKTWKIEAH
jgi:hypothetical protein